MLGYLLVSVPKRLLNKSKIALLTRLVGGCPT